MTTKSNTKSNTQSVTDFPLAQRALLTPKAPKAPKDITVQGVKVNSKIIAAYASRVESIDTLLSVWANAATIQMAKYGNRNWLDTLFNLPTLRLKSGELSKSGADVLSYITSHCPRIVWNKDNKTIGCLPYVEAEKLATHFIAFGATQVTDAAANVPSELAITKVRGKFYKEIGDFNLTLTEFKNFKKVTVPKAPSEPTMTVKAFNSSCDKASAFMAQAKFFGTVDELAQAKNKLKAMLDMVERLEKGLPAVASEDDHKAPTADTLPSVDTTSVDELIDETRLAAPLTANKKESK